MGWGGRLFEAGRLLTFSAFSMGAYSRWALIRGWALIRINTVVEWKCSCLKTMEETEMEEKSSSSHRKRTHESRKYSINVCIYQCADNSS